MSRKIDHPQRNRNTLVKRLRLKTKNRTSACTLARVFLLNGTSKNALKSVAAIMSLVATISMANAAEIIVLQDNFNRTDSPSLGVPWTQENQIFSEYTTSSGKKSGLSFTDLRNGALSFNYTAHSERSSNVFNATFDGPYVFAPLSMPADTSAVKAQFSFTPHSDERSSFEVGLMSSADGFLALGDGRHFRPMDGLSISLSRSGHPFNNSSIRVFKYVGGLEMILVSATLPFQLDFDNIYDIELFIGSDFSTSVTISNGSETVAISTDPFTFAKPLDQFFISDVDGGISFDTPGQVNVNAIFDDVLVSLVDAILTVGIDIKPGSFPNSINLSSGGATPVAILGDGILDLMDIDLNTLTFGSNGIKTVGKKDHQLCSIEDVSGDFSDVIFGLEGLPDSFDDLVCHFITYNIVPEAGDTEVKISGDFMSGGSFEGFDSVNIVP